MSTACQLNQARVAPTLAASLASPRPRPPSRMTDAADGPDAAQLAVLRLRFLQRETRRAACRYQHEAAAGDGCRPAAVERASCGQHKSKTSQDREASNTRITQTERHSAAYGGTIVRMPL